MQHNTPLAAPEPFPESVASRIDDFAGRTWLLAPVLDWLENSPERLLLITGEPGSGKSMAAAWLAGYGPAPEDPDARQKRERLRRLIKGVHFCIATTGSVSPKACAENLARQLSQRVEGFAAAQAASLSGLVNLSVKQRVGEVQAGGAVTGIHIGELNLGYLSEEAGFDRALRNPLIQLYRQGYQEPLVLLVDALDESLGRGGSGGVSIAALLSRLDDLPPQVRILATTRPDPRVLAYYRGAPRIDLIQDQPASSADLQDYSLRQLAASGAAQADRLAKRVVQAADGNFLYAHLVLADLQARPAASQELFEQSLPRNLSDIYRRFLIRERGEDEERWFRFLKPVLGLIAVSQEQGLSAAQLEQITGQDVEATLRACKQYLDGELPGGPFRPFHLSFSQFLLEDENNLDFHIDAPKMHRQIADWIWQARSAGWQSCDDYGLNHLSLHLFESGDFARLRELIGQDWIRLRYERGRASFAGLLKDFELAWQAAETANHAQLRARQAAAYLADEVRCALGRASINSLAARTAPGLALGLVKGGAWSGEQGLSYARNLSDPSARHRALLLLLPVLPPALQDGAIRDALAAAGQISSPSEQSLALAALLPALPAEERARVIAQAMEVVHRLQDSEEFDPAPHAPSFYGHPKPLETRYTGERSRALQALGRILEPFAGAELGAKLVAAWKQEDERARTQALEALAAELAMLPTSLQALSERDARDSGAASSTGAAPASVADQPPLIGDQQAIAAALADLSSAGHAGEPAAQPEEPVEEVFRRILQIDSHTARAQALAELLPRLPQALLPEALAAAREIDLPPWQRTRVDALLALAPRLPREVFQEATLLTRGAGEKVDLAMKAQARLLAALARDLPGDLLAEAFELAASLPRQPRKEIYLAYAGRTPDNYLHKALELIRRVEDENARAEGLAALAQRFPDDELGAVLEAVTRLRSEPERAAAWGGLLPRLPHGLVSTALEAAAQFADPRLRAQLLAALAPRLDAALQARLLEAVRREEPENARASLLLSVAPHLDSTRLPEALEMAHQLTTRKFCADVLTQIAIELPQDAPHRSTLLAESYACANEIVINSIGIIWADPYQATALLRLLPYLPSEQQAQMLEKIGEIIDSTNWNWWDAEFRQLSIDPQLEALAPEMVAALPQELKQAVYDKAIDAAMHPSTGRSYRHWIASAQVRGLSQLLPNLPAARQHEEIARIFQIIKDDLIDYCGYNCYPAYQRASDMQALAPYLTADLLAQAEAVDTENALPGAIPERLLAEMLETAQARRNAGWVFGIAPRLDEALLVAAVSAASAIGGAALQAEFVGKFAGDLARLPAQVLYSAWCDTLHSMASLNRSDFLQHFGLFSPIIAALAGAEALPGIHAALSEVGTWWP